VLGIPAKAPRFLQQIMRFLAAYPAYRGLSLDIESIPDDAEPAYLSFIQALYAQMHPRNLRSMSTWPCHQRQRPEAIAANSDGIVLMNYDEHQTTSDPGPVASQPGLSAICVACSRSCPRKKSSARGQLRLRLDAFHSQSQGSPHHPKPKVLNTDDLSVTDAWERASDADADLDLDYDTLNPHFEYIDEDNNQRHVVWFLDGVTVLNEMRAARQLGLQTFALWRLGEEDSSLWNVWDHPAIPRSLQALGTVQPGHDVDTEGDGDILRVTGLPQPGKRTVEVDTDEPDPRKKAHRRRAHGCVSAHLHRRAVRLPSQRGCAHLRRRPRSQVDAEDSRHPEASTSKAPSWPSAPRRGATSA
jgi:peptidoglycan-N-acetylglucosamine deacetylase